MPDITAVVLGGLVLGLGTYAFRLGGPAIRARLGDSERVDELLDTATIVLLTAVLVTTGLTEDGGFAGPSRAVAVGVGVVLAWRRAPFLLVVLGAAGVAAGLRLLGVP